MADYWLANITADLDNPNTQKMADIVDPYCEYNIVICDIYARTRILNKMWEDGANEDLRGAKVSTMTWRHKFSRVSINRIQYSFGLQSGLTNIVLQHTETG